MTVAEIKATLSRMPIDQAREVRDWLEGFIEDRLEPSDECKAIVERALRAPLQLCRLG